MVSTEQVDQFIEKTSHNDLRFYCSSRIFLLPGSVRLTDTSAETPFSCIVIPYRRSAISIVPRRCVMIRNCVVSLSRKR